MIGILKLISVGGVDVSSVAPLSAVDAEVVNSVLTKAFGMGQSQTDTIIGAMLGDTSATRADLEWAMSPILGTDNADALAWFADTIDRARVAAGAPALFNTERVANDVAPIDADAKPKPELMPSAVKVGLVALGALLLIVVARHIGGR